MLIEWTKHLKDPEEKARFETYIRANKQILDRLKDILSEREDALDRLERSKAVYQTPSWSHLQAHNNGSREELWFLKTLINLDQQK